MKQYFLTSALLAASVACFAQSQCGASHALFKTPASNSGETPAEIRKLGTSPEFPFLRNKASVQQFASALRNSDNSELNAMLMAIGFENGAKDVDASNVTTYYMPVGTKGNMGSGDYSVKYVELQGDASEFKSWKIASGTGCSMYIMAKCGNAFFPADEQKTACANVPVSIKTQDVTLTTTGQKITGTSNVYVYYHRKHHKKKDVAYAYTGVPDAYPSEPLLLNSKEKTEVVPQQYRVTVTGPDSAVNVCLDKPLDVAANINVEKTSEYAGYYPDASKKEYKLVKKHAYKKSARKMRKVARKEHKVEKATGVAVTTGAATSVAMNK